MALLDDLKGVLSPAEYEKIAANPALKTKVEKGGEFYDFYVGAADDPPPPAAVTPPPSASSTPPPSLDLGGIERLLDSRLGKLDERIATAVDSKLQTVIQTAGAQLRRDIVAQTDGLNRIYLRHSDEFHEAFDSAAFNEYLEKPENKIGDVAKPIGQGSASRFATMDLAYEAFVTPKRNTNAIAKGIADGIKNASGTHPVPGSTPGPGSNKTISIFQNRTAPGGTARTGADKAAAMLDRMSSQREAAAS